ncbi:IS4 family transposase [Bacteroides ovatus]|uniref:IS4 family transposase n=1 Tax=Bacteroides TaxID=816 RepID=UPI0005D26BCD|nr:MULTISPECIES: IS4 family transposase [Bacteroides]MCE9056292.1 IS4 family transposase [Bacteroides ovatus]UYU35687.1 IS4 family transposase [Bacteroides sp. DH3716P]
MNKDKYVFAQMVEFLDNYKFLRIVKKYDGNKYVKHFTCWNQLLTLMFGQLCNRESLRDLIVALNAHQEKCYHLGVGKHVTRSNLAKANENRDYRIFEDFAFHMISEARKKRVNDIFKLNGNVYAFDSTTIDLCLKLFPWANFSTYKGGIKIHTLYDVETQVPAFIHITEAKINDVRAMDVITYESGSFYVFDRAYNDYHRLYKIHMMDSFFVVRAKTNIKARVLKWKRRLPKNILSDCEIELTGFYTQKSYPETIRLVRFWDEEDEREFVYLTNAKHIPALQVAELYKNRWQVELFFKWLKQHLKIKKFWGTSENAVKIQVYSAIIAYCLVAIMQHDMKLNRSTYEVLQILGISLTDKTPLRNLFSKTKFNDVKEQNGLDGPNLFSNYNF